MLNHIRLATEEEVNKIRDKSDLMPGHTQVLALDAEGGSPDIAVVRRCVEVNPVIFGNKTANRRKLIFMHLLEERLLGAGIDRYYSQIDSADAQYQEIIEKMGFERVSPLPEYRYLRVIT